MRPLLVLLAGFLLASCDSAQPPTDDRVEITILVAYTDSAAAFVPDLSAQLDRALDETNAVYEASGIDIKLSPARVVRVDYVVNERFEALDHLIQSDDGVLDELHAIRDESEADVVLLVAGAPRSTVNGSLMARPETAFLIVRADALGAPSYGLAHELGHLQGARHDFESDPALDPFAYGHGFKNDSLRTIMVGGPQRLVPRFSGPDQTEGGVVLGDSTYRDVARVLRESAVYLSNFRGSQTPTDFAPPATFPTPP